MAKHVRRRLIPELRRQEILEAAISLIGQSGYHGFTIQKLAQACGLTNGGLLHYFGSKELLLVAILQERDRREAAIILAGLTHEPENAWRIGDDQTTALRTFGAIVARSAAQPELVRLLTVLNSEALNPEHPAHDYFQRREAMVLGEFANLLAGHVEDPRKTARAVLALIGGLEQQWLRADQGFDLVAECEAAIARLVHGPGAQGGGADQRAIACGVHAAD